MYRGGWESDGFQKDIVLLRGGLLDLVLGSIVIYNNYTII